MQYAELQHLLSQLPPGAKVSVVTVELPLAPGTASKKSIPPETIAEAPNATRAASDFIMRPTSAVQSHTMSVEDRLAALKVQHGGEGVLKPREWSRIVGLSEREIERAIRHRAVSSSAKGGGRDHAALTVSINAMETYLATVRAVEGHKMTAPPWWDLVRATGKRNALTVR